MRDDNGNRAIVERYDMFVIVRFNYRAFEILGRFATNDTSIENEKGSIRRGKDANGSEWESEMHSDYGYIRGTEGVDGDHIDVFLSDTPEQGDVFVVDQYNPDGSFDEHKVMYGFADSNAAREAYLANYDKGWENTRRIDVTGVSKDEFKKWIQSSKRKTKPFADYKSVTPIDEAYPTIATLQDYINYRNDVFNEEVAKLPDWLRPATFNSEYSEYPEIGAVSPEEYQRYISEAENMPGLTMADVAPQLKRGEPLSAEQHKMLRESERINALRMAKSFMKRAASRRPAAEEELEYDNQGNPIDEWGNLIVEPVESVDAITDKDFTEPYRTIGLPPLPEKVADAIGLQGAGPIIKKNVFDKNKKQHKDLTPEDGRIILNQTLYNPQLYGQNQKTSRPYNWILVHLADKNSAVVVEVNNPDKDNAEIVNWHYIGGEELERKKRQAAKEGGLILTLSEDNAVADTHDDLLSDGKDNTLSSDKQASAAESSQSALSATPQQSSDKSGSAFGLHDNSASYTITPATYTNKKGKETPMHRLEFGRELTKEEESAVKKFADEKIRSSSVSASSQGSVASEKTGESRFAPARGWKDRENGGWLFRTQEDARRAGELIGSDEAVADAQPLSREDVANEVRGQSDEGKGGRTSVQDGDSTDVRLSAGNVGKKNAAVYDAAKGMLEAAGIPVHEVSPEDAQSMLDVRVLRDGAGTVYGWTVGGEVYLNKDAMNPETPVHEYTHLWDMMVQRENPELWERGKELMKETPLWDEVKDDPAYSDIRDDEDAIASEVHSRLTGERGAEILDGMIKEAHEHGAFEEAEAVSLVARLRRWLREMFAGLKKTLGRWTKKDLRGLTADDFVGMTLRDLAEGINPNHGDKELVTLHNISESKLRKAIKAGGLTNPSMAVVKAGKNSHDGYGAITLVAHGAMADKRTGRNAGTWAGDAWTPTYPPIEREQNYMDKAAVISAITEAVPAEMRKLVIQGWESHLSGGNENALAYWFLSERGYARAVGKAARLAW